MGRYTGLLYSMPNALEGVGRLLDFSGEMDVYNMSRVGDEADRRALASDWWAIGDDMRAAIKSVARRQEVKIRHGR